MTYYVVRAQTPNQEIQTLVLVLDKDQNLEQQVTERVGPHYVIVSINILGVDWP